MLLSSLKYEALLYKAIHLLQHTLMGYVELN